MVLSYFKKEEFNEFRASLFYRNPLLQRLLYNTCNISIRPIQENDGAAETIKVFNDLVSVLLNWKGKLVCQPLILL